MQFRTPAMADSIPSFCAMLEYAWSIPERHRAPFHWKQASIIRNAWARSYYRARASEAQNHRCCYCGVLMCDPSNNSQSLTLEHVVPIGHGGVEHPYNYVAACRRCNNKRSSTPLEDFLKQIGLTAESILL